MSFSTKEAIDLALKVLDDHKAQNVVCISTKGWSSLTDAMIICHGTSTRHNKTLANKVHEAFKPNMTSGPYVEGEEDAEWVLVDCEAIMVHIMLEKTRDFYRLEALWSAHNQPSTS